MADKKNESKIMSMLERTGVIRKADAGDAYSTDTSNIKPLIDPPADAVKVTPAARQPIPGLITPVFPSENASEPEPVEPITEPTENINVYEEFDAIEIPQEPAYEPEVYEEEESPIKHTSYEPSLPTPSAPEPSPEPPPASSYTPAPYTPPPPAAPERAPTPENYTDRFLNIDELYSALALRSKKTDSIYLIEEYLDTLPGSLPDTQRRDIVNKLLAASGFDYDLLMGDGVLRVKMLKEYAERFARHTDDYIAARQAEIDELDKQILRARRLIENRRDLHKKQFFSIEAEAQRLKEILTFISG